MDKELVVIPDDASVEERRAKLFMRLFQVYDNMARHNVTLESVKAATGFPDKWWGTVAEAFWIATQGGDYESFLKKHAESGVPYPAKTDKE